MVTEVLTTPESVLSKAEQRKLGHLEKRIASGLQTFREVGQALLEIRDARLYRDTHSSFEAYAADRWGMERSRAYQLIDSAKVVNLLGDPDMLTNEAQARELASLEPDAVKEVWAAAEAKAEETHRPVTAALIRRVRAEVAPLASGFSTLATGQSPTERLMTDMVRLGNSFKRWQAAKPNAGERQKVRAATKALLAIIG